MPKLSRSKKAERLLFIGSCLSGGVLVSDLAQLLGIRPATIRAIYAVWKKDPAAALAEYRATRPAYVPRPARVPQPKPVVVKPAVDHTALMEMRRQEAVQRAAAKQARRFANRAAHDAQAAARAAAKKAQRTETV
jgi:hypothetical protein